MRRIGLMLVLSATLVGIIVITGYMTGTAQTTEEECTRAGRVWRGTTCEQPDGKHSQSSPSGEPRTQPTKWDERKKVAETVKDWGQMAAWIAAALFFGYKIVSGYFITNLALKIEARRMPKPDKADEDYLAITASLVGGSNGVIRIHDIQGRVIPSRDSLFHPWPSTGARPVPKATLIPQPPGGVGKLVGFERLSTYESKTPLSRWTVMWDRPANHLLNVSTGDACQFAAWTEVPSDCPCTVEV